LRVTSEATDGSSFVVQQVAANSAEFGIATAEPVLLGYEQNENFQSVYEFLTGNVFDTWVVADSPVQTLDDLEPGDAIAIKDLAGGEVPGLNVQLRGVGLEPDVDVEYVQFGENTGLGATLLADQEAAAMTISWNSLVGVDVALQESGIELRCITCDASTSLGSESVIVPNEFLEQNEDLVIAHGRALAKATLFGATNPEAALAIMNEVNPEEQVDAAYAEAYFTKAVEIMQPREPEGLYGWHDQDAWTRSMELLLAPDIPSGLPNEVDIDALVNNDLAEAYNEFDHDAVIQQAEEWTP
jgi:NitT/TauT family transport system substrate-binding protein